MDTKFSSEILDLGNSLAVQWLGLGALTAGAPGLIPGRGAKIPASHKAQPKKEKKKKLSTLLSRAEVVDLIPTRYAQINLSYKPIPKD